MSAVAEFFAAMEAAGLTPRGGIVADGALHRFHVDGDRRGTRNGWYLLHLDERPAGAFGSWRQGVKHTWSASGEGVEPARRDEWLRQVERARAERDAERRREADAAAGAAREEWLRAGPASADHPYLVRKGVQPAGMLRQSGRVLLAPMCNSAGMMRGLQRIFPDGSKRFLGGMAKAGTYFPLGRAGALFVVVEGVATGLTVHAATGLPVACSMDADNLPRVARALSQKYPTAKFVFGADCDRKGLAAAEHAAAAARGGLVLAPNLAAGEGTDWNDAAALHGVQWVRSAFATYLPAELANVA